jgi:hypothetical protein
MAFRLEEMERKVKGWRKGKEKERRIRHEEAHVPIKG